MLIGGFQGFGVTARSTAEVRRLDPTSITAFRQADVGEYLRDVSQSFPVSSYLSHLTAPQEDTLF